MSPTTCTTTLPPMSNTKVLPNPIVSCPPKSNGTAIRGILHSIVSSSTQTTTKDASPVLEEDDGTRPNDDDTKNIDTNPKEPSFVLSLSPQNE